MISKELNIGRAGQYLVLADLLLNGVQAYSTGEGVGYDVVADLKGKLIKIQVKTTQKMRILCNHSNPVYFFNIKMSGKTRTKYYQIGDFDVFALVGLDRRVIMYLPFDERIKSNSICIRDKNIEYKGKAMGGYKNGLYFQDLTWEEFTGKKAEQIQ